MNTELSGGEWTLDTTASSIGFQAKAAFGMKVNGRFGRHESTITVGSSVSESTVSSTIWTDSVDTGIKLRDEHLRADNVFASARFLPWSSAAPLSSKRPPGSTSAAPCASATSASRSPSRRHGRPQRAHPATPPQ